jgi:pimeloyl-ACP methyl ester carboxylesterase
LKIVRRLLFAAVAVLAVGLLAPSSTSAQPPGTRPGKPNILLVHGGFADGSSWNEVIRRLQRDGYTVVASQLPLSSFDADVAVVRRDLAALAGPTLVVGHSYGGAVITQAAAGAANVVGLVYVAAFAPDTGESAGSILGGYPALPSLAHIVPVSAAELILDRAHFGEDFAQDASREEQRLLAATQKPVHASTLGAAVTGTPAWRQVPAWYQVATADRMIPPAAERAMAAKVAGPARTIEVGTGHAAMVSRPVATAQFIERAATGR